MTPGWTYRRAGVDVDAANRTVKRLSAVVQGASRPEVVGGLGGFGGLFRFPSRAFRNPLLVAATDGVGTKLKVAFALGRHDTVGVDLVAMSVNDILVQGAEPLFFLDYIACGRLKPDRVTAIVEGVAEGCRMAGCALLGGETAEMPGFYQEGEYDLAGFAVGVVERGRLIDGRRVRPGDLLLGLPSSGLHSNGYSLARAIVAGTGGRNPWRHRPPGWERSIGEALLEPTRIYTRPLREIFGRFRARGVVHLTGGGWRDNIVRVLPPRCAARIESGSWPIPEIFPYLQRTGDVSRREMFRTFNMGIGMIVIASPSEVKKMKSRLDRIGEAGYVIGRIEEGRRGVTFSRPGRAGS